MSSRLENIKAVNKALLHIAAVKTEFTAVEILFQIEQDIADNVQRLVPVKDFHYLATLQTASQEITLAIAALEKISKLMLEHDKSFEVACDDVTDATSRFHVPGLKKHFDVLFDAKLKEKIQEDIAYGALEAALNPEESNLNTTEIWQIAKKQVKNGDYSFGSDARLPSMLRLAADASRKYGDASIVHGDGILINDNSKQAMRYVTAESIIFGLCMILTFGYVVRKPAASLLTNTGKVLGFLSSAKTADHAYVAVPVRDDAADQNNQSSFLCFGRKK